MGVVLPHVLGHAHGDDTMSDSQAAVVLEGFSDMGSTLCADLRAEVDTLRDRVKIERQKSRRISKAHHEVVLRNEESLILLCH